MSEAAVVIRKRPNIIRRFFQIREIGALLPLIIIFIAAAFSNPAFTSIANILNMLRAMSYIFIVGVGMPFVLCGRGLDLSVGSQVGLAGGILGIATLWWKLPIWASVPTALAFGALAGGVKWFLCPVSPHPPFLPLLAPL